MASGPPDITYWTSRAPAVSPAWFLQASSLHGVTHTQRVHIHVQRLAHELHSSEPDKHAALCAALWHDIGRTNDDVDPRHGADSALRADRLGLTAALSPADAEVVRFAIHWHSLSDEAAEEAVRPSAEAGHGAAQQALARRLAQPERASRSPERALAEPERALRVLWLLKDADALDRVRLAPWEAADPEQLRHEQTKVLLPFADELFAALP